MAVYIQAALPLLCICLLYTSTGYASTRYAFRSARQQHYRRIGHFHKSRVGNFKHADFVCRTVSPVTFGGETKKDVKPDESYTSDTVTINIPEGHYLVWEWTWLWKAD